MLRMITYLQESLRIPCWLLQGEEDEFFAIGVEGQSIYVNQISRVDREQNHLRDNLLNHMSFLDTR